MSDSDIEQGAPPPVSSLRSRFEALAAQQNGGAGTNAGPSSNDAPLKDNFSFSTGTELVASRLGMQALAVGEETCLIPPFLRYHHS